MKRLFKALERRSLKAKLLLGFTGLMLITFVVGIDAIVGQRQLSTQIEHLYEKELLGVSAIKEARIQYAFIGRIVRMAILAREPEERDHALKQLAEAETAMK